MKYQISFTERALLLKRLLYLRYGSTEPDKVNKPKPILPISLIANLLKAPCEALKHMDWKYFANKEYKKPDISKVSVTNVTLPELKFILS